MGDGTVCPVFCVYIYMPYIYPTSGEREKKKKTKTKKRKRS